MIPDLKRLIEQVSRDKGIEREVLVTTLEEAMKSAARKKFGHDLDLEVAYNEEFGELEAFQFKEVVEEVTDSLLEISLEEGRELDPDCELGDSLGIKLDTDTFGRIAAQSAKQVIIQKMKDAEREMIYEDYKDRIGEIINGIVQRLDRGGITVNLGRAEAVVPYREQVPRETYRRGDRIRALVLDVNRESRGPQIILSRTHPDFIANLFSSEVPEIAEGIVTIMAAVREPGSRAKIAVTSKDPDIDPVGACVGMKGSRVQSVVQELRGEKIDIIEYNPDPARYVVNALAPAVISKVVIDQANRLMEVIVPDDQLSLAIGKRGKTCGWLRNWPSGALTLRARRSIRNRSKMAMILSWLCQVSGIPLLTICMRLVLPRRRNWPALRRRNWWRFQVSVNRRPRSSSRRPRFTRASER